MQSAHVAEVLRLMNTPLVRTMGGLPRAVIFPAIRHLSALVTVAAPLVEPGPTGSARFGTRTSAREQPH